MSLIDDQIAAKSPEDNQIVAQASQEADAAERQQRQEQAQEAAATARQQAQAESDQMRDQKAQGYEFEHDPFTGKSVPLVDPANPDLGPLRRKKGSGVYRNEAGHYLERDYQNGGFKDAIQGKPLKFKADGTAAVRVGQEDVDVSDHPEVRKKLDDRNDIDAEENAAKASVRDLATASVENRKTVRLAKEKLEDAAAAMGAIKKKWDGTPGTPENQAQAIAETAKAQADHDAAAAAYTALKRSEENHIEGQRNAAQRRVDNVIALRRLWRQGRLPDDWRNSFNPLSGPKPLPNPNANPPTALLPDDQNTGQTQGAPDAPNPPPDSVSSSKPAPDIGQPVLGASIANSGTLTPSTSVSSSAQPTPQVNPATIAALPTPEASKAIEANAPKVQAAQQAVAEQRAQVVAPLDQLSQQQQAIDAKMQELAAAKDQPLTAGKPANLNVKTFMDGRQETWADDRFDAFKELNAQHADIEEQKQEYTRDNHAALTDYAQNAADADKLAKDHNDAVAALNAKQEAETKAHRDELRKNPVTADYADKLDDIDAETKDNAEAIKGKYPEGPARDAAMQAMLEVQNKSAQDVHQEIATTKATGPNNQWQVAQRIYAAEKDAEDKKRVERTSLKNYSEDGSYTGLSEEDLAKKFDSPVAAKRESALKTIGLTEDQIKPLIEDVGKLDFARNGKQANVLSGGSLAVSPANYLDKDAYTKAVNTSDATQEAKDTALAKFPELQNTAANQFYDGIKKIDPEFARRELDVMPGENEAEKTIAFMNRGGMSRFWTQIKAKVGADISSNQAALGGLIALTVGAGASAIKKLGFDGPNILDAASNAMHDYAVQASKEGQSDEAVAAAMKTGVMGGAVSGVIGFIPDFALAAGIGSASQAGKLALGEGSKVISGINEATQMMRTAAATADKSLAMQAYEKFLLAQGADSAAVMPKVAALADKFRLSGASALPGDIIAALHDVAGEKMGKMLAAEGITGANAGAGYFAAKTGGDTYVDAYQKNLEALQAQGVDGEAAKLKARGNAILPAVVNAAITYAIFRNKGLGDVFSNQQTTKAMLEQTLGQIAKDVGQHAAIDAGKLGLDTLAHSIVAKASFDPTKSPQSILEETMQAALTGAAMGGFTRLIHHASTKLSGRGGKSSEKGLSNPDARSPQGDTSAPEPTAPFSTEPPTPPKSLPVTGLKEQPQSKSMEAAENAAADAELQNIPTKSAEIATKYPDAPTDPTGVKTRTMLEVARGNALNLHPEELASVGLTVKDGALTTIKPTDGGKAYFAIDHGIAVPSISAATDVGLWGAPTAAKIIARHMDAQMEAIKQARLNPTSPSKETATSTAATATIPSVESSPKAGATPDEGGVGKAQGGAEATPAEAPPAKPAIFKTPDGTTHQLKGATDAEKLEEVKKLLLDSAQQKGAPAKESPKEEQKTSNDAKKLTKRAESLVNLLNKTGKVKGAITDKTGNASGVEYDPVKGEIAINPQAVAEFTKELTPKEVDKWLTDTVLNHELAHHIFESDAAAKGALDEHWQNVTDEDKTASAEAYYGHAGAKWDSEFRAKHEYAAQLLEAAQKGTLGKQLIDLLKGKGAEFIKSLTKLLETLENHFKKILSDPSAKGHETAQKVVAEFARAKKELFDSTVKFKAAPEGIPSATEVAKSASEVHKQEKKADVGAAVKKVIPDSPTVDAIAHEAATSPTNNLPLPTEPQKEAGNYQKGHVSLSGLDISIENPAGSKRNEAWPALKDHYGYIKGTVGKDKDHIDVFIKPGTPLDYSGPVFVVNQKNPSTKTFDEHKVVIGVGNNSEAYNLYRSNYSADYKGYWSMATFPSVPAFKEWLKTGDHSQPAISPKAETNSGDKSGQTQVPAVIPPAASGEAPIASSFATGDGGTVADKEQTATSEAFIDKATSVYSQVHQSRIKKDFAKPGRGQETLQASLDEWSVARLRPRVAEFVREIADKDFQKLDIKNNGMWPAFWRIFALQTRIKVPATQKGIDEMLKKYVGAQAYDDYREKQASARAEHQAQESSKDAARSLQYAKQDAASVNIASGGKGDEWVEKRLAEGWRVQNTSETPIPRYQFVNPEGRTYKATKGLKPLLDYGRKLQVGMPEPEAPPDINKSGQPDISEADAAHLFGKPTPTPSNEHATNEHGGSNAAPRGQQTNQVEPARQGADSKAKEETGQGQKESAVPKTDGTEDARSSVEARAVPKQSVHAADDSVKPTSGASAATMAKAKDAFSDLQASAPEPLQASAPEALTQAALPRERRAKFMDLADSLIEDGITEPSKLAAFLDEVAPDKRLRKYARAMWGYLTSANPDLADVSDWSEIYGSLDAATKPEQPTTGTLQERIASIVRGKMVRGEELNTKGLKTIVASAGGNDDELTHKQVDEAVELGITQAARDIVQRNGDTQETFNELLKLYENQPVLNAKTSTSKNNQALSTPAPLAFVASHIADIKGGKVVIEPTVGNGMLTIETTPRQKVIVNELDPKRVERLHLLNPTLEVSTGDATAWTPTTKGDRGIANPPFGSVMGDHGMPRLFETPFGKTPQIDHAIVVQMLENDLEPGARFTFIIGGPAPTVKTEQNRANHYSGGIKGAFFKWLYENHRVIDHFTASGDLYKKQGAGWPVDVITVDGIGASPLSLPTLKAPRMLETWKDVSHELDRTDEERIQLGRYTAEQLGARVDSMADALGGLAKPASTVREGGSQPSNADILSTGGDAGSGKSTSAGAGEQSLPVPSTRSGDDAARTSERSEERPRVESGSRSLSGPDRQRELADESGETFQKPYITGSGVNSSGLLAPVNLVHPMETAMNRLKAKVGELAPFVAKELGYKAGDDITKYFYGEQIDALALAIDNFKNGGALVIGDQTGTGKGRIAAGLLRYAVEHGIIPIFVTKNQELYEAMISDLADINAAHVIPAITDNMMKSEQLRARKLHNGKEVFEEIAQTGKMPVGANAIFTT
jgi:hypothetical protein